MCCSLYDEDMFTQMEWHVLNTLERFDPIILLAVNLHDRALNKFEEVSDSSQLCI